MKKIMVVVFFVMAVTFNAFASETRVSRLGPAWLVPDEYTDALFNPARINRLEKTVFTGTLDMFLFTQGFSPAGDGFSMIFYPKLGYMGVFGTVRAGLLYDFRYGMNEYEGAFTPYGTDNSVSAVYGMKITDMVSFGIKPSAGTHFNANEEPNLTFEGALDFGIEVDLEGMSFGAAAGAGNRFTGMKNYSWNAKLHGEIRTGSDSVIRFMNEMNDYSGEGGLVLNAAVNPFGDMFFGGRSTHNLTGLSYVNSFYTLKYFLELYNDWDIYSYANSATVNPMDYNRTETALQGDRVYAQIGVETELFADWFIFRMSYMLFNLQYTCTFIHEETQFSDNFYRNAQTVVDLMPVSYFRMGLGFKLWGDAVLDAAFDAAGLLHFDDSRSLLDESWGNTSYCVFVLEYTTRW